MIQSPPVFEHGSAVQEETLVPSEKSWSQQLAQVKRYNWVAERSAESLGQLQVCAEKHGDTGAQHGDYDNKARMQTYRTIEKQIREKQGWGNRVGGRAVSPRTATM